MKTFKRNLQGQLTEADYKFKLVYEQNVALMAKTGDPSSIVSAYDLWIVSRCPQTLTNTEGRMMAYKAFLKRIGAIADYQTEV